MPPRRSRGDTFRPVRARVHSVDVVDDPSASGLADRAGDARTGFRRGRHAALRGRSRQCSRRGGFEIRTHRRSIGPCARRCRRARPARRERRRTHPASRRGADGADASRRDARIRQSGRCTGLLGARLQCLRRMLRRPGPAGQHPLDGRACGPFVRSARIARYSTVFRAPGARATAESPFRLSGPSALGRPSCNARVRRSGCSPPATSLRRPSAPADEPTPMYPWEDP